MKFRYTLFLLFTILACVYSLDVSAQKTTNRIIYTGGTVPASCVNGYVYVNPATGFVYTFKTGIGCFLSGGVVDGSGAANRIAYWSDADTLSSTSGLSFSSNNLSIPTGGQFQINGTAFNFSNLAGNIAVSQMNSGTSASSSTFWRGDGTWSTILAGLSDNGTSITSTRHLLFSADNTKDIGASGSGRPANVYVGGTISGTSLYIHNLFFGAGTSSRITGASNGNLLLINNAATDFLCLQFGGTTASFPCIRRNGVNLQAKLADNSAFTDIDVLDEAYAIGWNGSNEVPTKNAIYDKIETISGCTTCEQLLTPGGVSINLNTTSTQDIYTVPVGKTLITTRIMIGNPSVDLSTAGPVTLSFTENGGGGTIATSMNTAALTTSNTVRHSVVSATSLLIPAGNKLQTTPSVAFGSAATVNVYLFGYLI